MLTNQFPGVHVKEIPSGARPIASISTSNTVFIDVFKRGPMDKAVRLTSMADFETIFGGVWSKSEASYAIQQYFLNGGNVAFVIRVGADGAGDGSEPLAAASATIKKAGDPTTDALSIEAKTPGAAGNNIYYGLIPVKDETKYHLLVRQYDGASVVAEEVYGNISYATKSGVDAANAGSRLVTLDAVGNNSANREPEPSTSAIDLTAVTDATARLNALVALGKSDLTALAGGQPDPQLVKATRAGAELSITAREFGSWGNSIFVATAEHASGTQYDLLVRLYSGSKVIAEELYQGISNTDDPTDPAMAENIVNGASALVSVEVHAAGIPTIGSFTPENLLDGTTQPAQPNSMEALGNGDDGLVPFIGDWSLNIANAIQGSNAARTGMNALEDIVPDVFNLMCIPVASLMDESDAKNVYEAAEKFCRDRFAFLLLDPSVDATKDDVYDWFQGMGSAASRNAAGYFPRLSFSDPLAGGAPRTVGPSGMVAGMMARIDASRGVWKSTAGTETRFGGGAPEQLLTDLEQEPLNRLGVNVLRSFPVYGNIIWGARTMVGADDLADEYKYVAVRRTAIFIQQSLQRGLKWTVFEGNDERLWGQIRMNVKAFMQGLHRQGAFQGTIADDAYLVKCDSETTTQADIDLGIVNILVAFAPLKPAEFVVLNFKQLTKLPE